MNIPVNLILARNNILQTIEKWADTIPLGYDAVRSDTNRMLKCLPIWNYIQGNINVYIHKIWNFAVAHVGITFLQYCFVSNISKSNKCGALLSQWMMDCRKQISLENELPETLFNYITQFLSHADLIKFGALNRILYYDWLHCAYSAKLYLKLSKIHINAGNVCQTWCNILGMDRMIFILLFDERCIKLQLLDKLAAELRVNILVHKHNTMPYIAQKMCKDIWGLIVSYFAYNDYCNVGITCPWLYIFLNMNQLHLQMIDAHKMFISDEVYSKWKYGWSRCHLWSNVRVIINTMGVEHENATSDYPFKHLEPSLLHAYLGNVFILKNINNISQELPLLKIVLCNRTHKIINHGFDQLWNHDLSHFILYNNWQAECPMHVQCAKFIAANGDIGVCNVVDLFAHNICKVFVCWSNTMWNNNYYDNAHTLPPTKNVLRDKHVIWINTYQWSPLLKIASFTYFAFCIRTFTLVTQWQDISVLISDWCDLLINTDFFPTLQNVTFIFVIEGNISLVRSTYIAFRGMWEWFVNNCNKISEKLSIKSWTMCLIRSGTKDYGHCFDVCNIWNLKQLINYRQQWLKIIDNQNYVSQDESKKSFIHWNHFISQLFD